MGSATHSAAGLVPMPSSSSAPSTKPSMVPPSARSAVDSVDAALVRSTDRVPRTTQNPCWTPDMSATRTAAASASDPRRLFRNQTERKLACLVRTPIAPAIEAARRSATVPSGWTPYQPRRRAAIVSGSARRVAIRASATMFLTTRAIACAWKACRAMISTESPPTSASSAMPAADRW